MRVNPRFNMEIDTSGFLVFFFLAWNRNILVRFCFKTEVQTPKCCGCRVVLSLNGMRLGKTKPWKKPWDFVHSRFFSSSFHFCEPFQRLTQPTMMKLFMVANAATTRSFITRGYHNYLYQCCQKIKPLTNVGTCTSL